MKFLADMGVSPRAVQTLRGQGFDIDHIAEREEPRASDSRILALARKDGRTVITFDLDFARLMALSLAPLPSVIIFRTSDQGPDLVVERLAEIAQRFGTEIEAGVILVVENERYRTRSLPIGF